MAAYELRDGDSGVVVRPLHVSVGGGVDLAAAAGAGQESAGVAQTQANAPAPAKPPELVPIWVEGLIGTVMLVAVWCRHRSKLTVPKAIASVASVWCLLLAMAMVSSSFGCPWSTAIVLKKQTWAYFCGGLFMIAYSLKGLGFAFGSKAEGVETHDAMPHAPTAGHS